MEGLKSVSQIAKELGTNKSKVWRIIHSLNVHERLADGNKKLFADDDINRIRAEFIRLSEGVPNVRPNERTDEPKQTPKADRFEEPDRLKETYEERLAAKDEIILELRRQIESERQRNDQLTELLRNEQENLRQQQQSMMILAAASKPRLMDKVKSFFGKGDKQDTDKEQPIM